MTTGARTSGPGRLGAGLVEIPAVPYRDPADVVLADPTVPASRRYCAACGAPVGRGRDGTPGRAAGFCPRCGTAFSFAPKLQPGDRVAGQYEVVGCLAHGGMGWIYLAKDHNVSERWVVLKGLLIVGDRDATAAALAERRFLAEVEHPNIVKIFNFVEHESSGYIVMEYVGGRSLKQILTARREAAAGEPDPLPASQAIAYILEALPALGYLHDSGLLFCDFKLDNVIQTRHALTLIDLGGVRRWGDTSSAVYGTVGYEAPEVAATGPSVASDLFTVARTLALLCLDFPGYQSTYRFTLPPRAEAPLLARYDALHQLLLKGTAPDPDDRFQSAEEMAGQLYGVLREVVADVEGRPVPAASTLFTPARRADLERPSWPTLPQPHVSRDDVELRLAGALIESGDCDGADAVLAEIAERDRWEWRVWWYRGVAAFARDRPDLAQAAFRAVYEALPGELAPKLALGVACESGGDWAEAAGWYDVVSKTDPAVTSATFGVARCRLALGDRAGALAAYERVPDSSSGYMDAQTARIRCVTSGNGRLATLAELLSAGAQLEGLTVGPETREQLTAELLEAALALALSGQMLDDGRTSLLGHRLDERELRLALEAAYRSLARRASSRAERVRLVDRANHTRPRTWR